MNNEINNDGLMQNDNTNPTPSVTPDVTPVSEVNTIPPVEPQPVNQGVGMEPAVNNTMPTMIPDQSIPPIQDAQINNMEGNSQVAPIESVNSVQPEPSVTGSPVGPEQNIFASPSLTEPSENSTPVEPTQTAPVDTGVNDEDLLKMFIGKNSEKITTRPFNFAAFFFTSLYMCYRKMFLFGLLYFIVTLVVINVAKTYLATLAFSILAGLIFNKIYVSHAKKKVAVIKAKNSDKRSEELVSICTRKGGTSGGQLFLGILAHLAVAIVTLIVMVAIGIGNFIGDLLHIDDLDIPFFKKVDEAAEVSSNPDSLKDSKLIEDANITGYACFGKTCNISVDTQDGELTLSTGNGDLFKALQDNKDYVSVNIYYKESGSDKTITGYKIYNKDNNEELSGIKTEEDLRNKLGLYSLGTHTAKMKLKEIGTPGVGFVDSESYTYSTYIFVNDKNHEFEMKYKNGELNLTEGNEYTVTFEVVEGIFDYDYNIKSAN